MVIKPHKLLCYMPLLVFLPLIVQKPQNVNVISCKCNLLTHEAPKSSRSSRKVSVRSRSNWNLEMLVFAEGGKPENPEKNPQSKDENQQQTQPTYDAETGNRTRATLVGGDCSHHCAIPSPPTYIEMYWSN